MTSKLANIEKIYRNNPKLKKSDVDKLADWVKTQPHLPKLEELQIILFFHCCKFQLNDAQKTIENYFTFRTTSVLCQNLNKETIRQTLSCCFSGFMPKKTPDGDVVLLVKMLDTRPEIYNCLEHLKAFVATITLHFHQYGPANGLVVVCDTRGPSLKHLFRLNLSLMRQFIYFLEEASPMKIKFLHFVNAASIMQRFLNVLSPYMKKSIHEKMKFYSDSIHELYESVPRECLPEDYGGFLPKSEELFVTIVTNFFDQWELLQWHETQKVDENKKIKKEKGYFGKLFSDS